MGAEASQCSEVSRVYEGFEVLRLLGVIFFAFPTTVGSGSFGVGVGTGGKREGNVKPLFRKWVVGAPFPFVASALEGE